MAAMSHFSSSNVSVTRRSLYGIGLSDVFDAPVRIEVTNMPESMSPDDARASGAALIAAADSVLPDDTVAPPVSFDVKEIHKALLRLKRERGDVTLGLS